MNRAKLALSRTTNFVADHRVALAVIITAAVTTVVALKITEGGVKDRDEFLAEKGLSDEYINWLIETSGI